jgi:CBS domain-containing protein
MVSGAPQFEGDFAMTVARIMKDKGHVVITASPHRTLKEIVDILATKRIGAIMVTGADNTIKGIISERDIVRALAKGGAAALDDAVSLHMTRDVITCASHDHINHVMEEMTRGRFRHMPVVDGGTLTGIISIGDVVKIRIEESEAESRSLREYIQMGT